jgi:hypothetical protein
MTSETQLIRAPRVPNGASGDGGLRSINDIPSSAPTGSCSSLASRPRRLPSRKQLRTAVGELHIRGRSHAAIAIPAQPRARSRCGSRGSYRLMLETTLDVLDVDAAILHPPPRVICKYLPLWL